MAVSHFSSGHKLKHNLHGAWKLLQSSMQFTILRFQGLTEFDAAHYLSGQGTGTTASTGAGGGLPYAAVSGATVLPAVKASLTQFAATPAYSGYFQPGFYTIGQGWTGTGTGTVGCPLYAFDLTSGFNIVADGTVGTYASPMGRMVLNYGTTATSPQTVTSVNFNIQPQDASNVGLTGWAYETFSAPSNNAPNRRDLLDWVQAKFVLYGSQSQPITYHIQFVQFQKDYLVPEFVITDASVTSEVQERNNFWTKQVSESLFNPIQTPANTGASLKSQMKVLKSWEFRLAPKLSTELDPFPRKEVVTIFHRFNRIRKWDWADEDTTQGGTSLSDLGIEGPGYVTSIGQTNNVLTPRARVYMIVKATCFDSITQGNDPIAGSFDMCVRQKSTLIF